MEPYACRNGDYFFLINGEELETLKTSSLESDLLLEGGKHAGKKGRLSFKANGDTKLAIKRYPADHGWDEIKIIELILNQVGYNEIYQSGLVRFGDLGIDYYVQDILRANN